MSDIGDDKNIQKLLQMRIWYFLFTIPHKVVFKDFAYFLGTVTYIVFYITPILTKSIIIHIIL